MKNYSPSYVPWTFPLQNISLSMPKTAYLKLIDIWLIFCLVVPFVTFIVQIFWELQRAKRDRNAKGWMAKETENSKSVKIIQYSVVSLTLILIVFYWSYAFAVYFDLRPWWKLKVGTWIIILSHFPSWCKYKCNLNCIENVTY